MASAIIKAMLYNVLSGFIINLEFYGEKKRAVKINKVIIMEFKNLNRNNKTYCVVLYFADSSFLFNKQKNEFELF